VDKFSAAWPILTRQSSSLKATANTQCNPVFTDQWSRITRSIFAASSDFILLMSYLTASLQRPSTNLFALIFYDAGNQARQFV
jgi:hypothetical protein